MKMKLEIYQNKTLVNTIESEDEKEIFEKIAQCLLAKEIKRATKTSITYAWCDLQKIKQYFDRTKTQTQNTYTYIYYFEGVRI